MSQLNASPLESAILKQFYRMYGSLGFPKPEEICVSHRENTGAGRYVYLQLNADTELEDGYLDLGGHFIEMEGVPNGMMAVVRIKNHRLDHLEIAVYGNTTWDGNENAWSIV